MAEAGLDIAHPRNFCAGSAPSSLWSTCITFPSFPGTCLGKWGKSGLWGTLLAPVQSTGCKHGGVTVPLTPYESSSPSIFAYVQGEILCWGILSRALADVKVGSHLHKFSPSPLSACRHTWDTSNFQHRVRKGGTQLQVGVSPCLQVCQGMATNTLQHS